MLIELLLRSYLKETFALDFYDGYLNDILHPLENEVESKEWLQAWCDRLFEIVES